MKKMIAAAGVAASMVIGVVGGVAFGVPTLVAAQEQSPEAPAAKRAPKESKPGCGPHRGHVARRLAMDTVAEVLGMTNTELREALSAGKTIADVADEKGVAVQSVIDALVAERLAKLTARVTAFVNGAGPAFKGGDRQHGPRGRIAPAGAPGDPGDATPA